MKKPKVLYFGQWMAEEFLARSAILSPWQDLDLDIGSNRYGNYVTQSFYEGKDMRVVAVLCTDVKFYLADEGVDWLGEMIINKETAINIVINDLKYNTLRDYYFSMVYEKHPKNVAENKPIYDALVEVVNNVEMFLRK